VFAVPLLDKLKIDDVVGAIPVHLFAGIWGTLAVGLFASPRLIVEGASPGFWYGLTDGDVAIGGTLGQLGVQAVAVVATFVVVFAISYATFAIIKATIGLRVSEEEELSGLDISTHGMYGYPEAFIPQEEYPVGRFEPSVAGTPVATETAASDTRPLVKS